MIIRYDPENGDVVPDSQIESWLLSHIERYEITVGSNLMIDIARLLHKQQKIHIDYFLYTNTEGQEYMLFIRNDGRLPDWPAGFCDIIENTYSTFIDLERNE